MKFGGTSVADPEAIKRLIGIVRHQLESQKGGDDAPVVVVSALAKVTDQLVQVARLAEDGEADRAADALRALLDRHVAVASAVTSESRAETVAKVRQEFEELIGLVHALAVLREVSPRSLDAVLAAGEVVSSRIVAAAIADHRIESVWVDARGVIVTDSEYNAAVPDMLETADRTRDRVAPHASRCRVAVLGGFIGSTSNGVTTTLGRGGSDYSAAIFGACLGVDEIQIWTDVDGMLTADPRIVPQPRVVPQLSFAEASELAYFGAKVLHPSTILPAVDRNIPVRILNARRPDQPGTRITADGGAADGQLTAIACKRDVTVVDITSTRMLMAHGFLRRLFEVFERFKTPVDVVTTSEVSVSVTVDDARRLDAIVDNLRNFAQVNCEREMAIICAVGENLRTDPTLFGRAVTALDRVPLRLVSQAASRRNITFVLRDGDVPHAMTRLHQQFFERR
ncbi:MAG: lysine-sensitive aspartokinase 3 [Acidobacteria bacterium]|nr:MAG: lysine-sensitive aspartokinase 3 [Acidobacteriota bacterium]PYQ87171.1 MAG: lysine-sensitive aspartokinase 3 [Acidobacteriota bacterium]PYQ88336.1 MAG: lysine-sensitive aspartokinase 3 [Acidobacteriota bacterium]PYR11469.1 MAG: lysine-sensitive aspartokinase 3 [Acidobacteriota bacterium]